MIVDRGPGGRPLWRVAPSRTTTVIDGRPWQAAAVAGGGPGVAVPRSPASGRGGRRSSRTEAVADGGSGRRPAVPEWTGRPWRAAAVAGGGPVGRRLWCGRAEVSGRQAAAVVDEGRGARGRRWRQWWLWPAVAVTMAF